VGGEQVEGRQAIREALRAKRRKLRELYVSTGLEPSPILTEIKDLAEEAGDTVRLVPTERNDKQARTDAPQGVVLRGEPLPEADVDDLIEAPGAFLVVLEGVTDPQNLGAVLRSAEGAGVTGVLLPKHRTVHVTPAVTKTAAGAADRVPIGLVGGLGGLLDRAAREGVWTVGLDDRGPISLWEMDVTAADRVLVVLGAEGRGLPRLAKERCDALVRIPMGGQLSSLNVSAAATLALFEIARQRR
jgi:23S rRNA (guanosine2251-2'-O)-methyltransferase